MFDFTVKDCNNDTAINVSCGYPSLVWVTRILASKKDVNPNVVNDFNCTALTTCICKKNLEALEVIGQRPDLKVSSRDKELAKKLGIDLKKYIKPTDSIFGKYTAEGITQHEEARAEALECEFATAFN